MRKNGDNLTLSSYEILHKFSNESVAVSYFEDIRWKNGKCCPHCNHDKITKCTRAYFYYCPKCKKKFTVKTNTVMDHSHIGVGKWMYAIYMILTARKGISSMQLSKELGITQKSSWFMLQRIRTACTTKEKLCGIVEVDETYIGGKEDNKHEINKQRLGRGSVGKIPVFGMKSRNGRTKAIVLENVTKDTIQEIIRKNVRKGSVICSDDFKSYKGLNKTYSHYVVNHSAKQYVDGMAHTNGIESMWAVLKRGFYGTYHKFSIKHLQKYVNEFSFRLSKGSVKICTQERMNSLLENFSCGKISYNMCIAGL